MTMGEMRPRTRLEVLGLKRVPRPGRLMQVPHAQGSLKTLNYRHGMVLLSLLIVRIGIAVGTTGDLGWAVVRAFEIFCGRAVSRCDIVRPDYPEREGKDGV